MSLVKHFAIILGMFLLGDFTSDLFHMTVPGNVLGMAFLTISLMAGIVKLEDVEAGANLLLNHLAIFFIPPSVGIMLYFDVIKEQFFVIILPVIFSIVIGLIITGKVVEKVAEGEDVE